MEKNKATGQSHKACVHGRQLWTADARVKSMSLMTQRNEARFQTIFSKQILQRWTNHILKDYTTKEDCKCNYKKCELDNWNNSVWPLILEVHKASLHIQVKLLLTLWEIYHARKYFQDTTHSYFPFNYLLVLLIFLMSLFSPRTLRAY